MIHLVGKYYAQCDNMGYTLLKKGKSKAGEEVYRPCGYLGDEEHLIAHCIKKRVEDRVKNKDLELKEFLAIIREENHITQDLLRQAIQNEAQEVITNAKRLQNPAGDQG